MEIKKKFKIKVKDYAPIPPSLISGKLLKTDIEINLKKVALAIARDQRTYYSSSILFRNGLINQSLFDPIFINLLNIFTNDLYATLKFVKIPFLKDWKRILSYSLGTGIGRVALEEYLDVVWTDNIDYYSDSYPGLHAYRLKIFKNVFIKNCFITVKGKKVRVSGDAPDAICLLSNGTVCMAEFKGRLRDSISDQMLDSWKNQFSRVRLITKDKAPVSKINHICATRLKIDDQSNRIHSKIYFCDPPTKTIIQPNEDNSNVEISREHIVISHYIRGCSALGFNVLARALSFKLTTKENNIPFILITDEVEEVTVLENDYKIVIPKKRTKSNWNFVYDESIIGMDLDLYNTLKYYIYNDFSFDDIRKISSNEIQFENFNIIRLKDGFVAVPLSLIKK